MEGLKPEQGVVEAWQAGVAGLCRATSRPQRVSTQRDTSGGLWAYRRRNVWRLADFKRVRVRRISLCEGALFYALYTVDENSITLLMRYAECGCDYFVLELSALLPEKSLLPFGSCDTCFCHFSPLPLSFLTLGFCFFSAVSVPGLE